MANRETLVEGVACENPTPYLAPPPSSWLSSCVCGVRRLILQTRFPLGRGIACLKPPEIDSPSRAGETTKLSLATHDGSVQIAAGGPVDRAGVPWETLKHFLGAVDRFSGDLAGG